MIAVGVLARGAVKAGHTGIRLFPNHLRIRIVDLALAASLPEEDSARRVVQPCSNRFLIASCDTGPLLQASLCSKPDTDGSCRHAVARRALELFHAWTKARGLTYELDHPSSRKGYEVDYHVYRNSLYLLILADALSSLLL